MKKKKNTIDPSVPYLEPQMFFVLQLSTIKSQFVDLVIHEISNPSNLVHIDKYIDRIF